ncbi:hypothetical protein CAUPRSCDRAFT_11160 [Caulochytrium protostelioides]|nr:hypothetical protein CAUPRSCDRAFT_11160 [Caulochytrium protostelioides]
MVITLGLSAVREAVAFSPLSFRAAMDAAEALSGPPAGESGGAAKAPQDDPEFIAKFAKYLTIQSTHLADFGPAGGSTLARRDLQSPAPASSTSTAHESFETDLPTYRFRIGCYAATRSLLGSDIPIPCKVSVHLGHRETLVAVDQHQQTLVQITTDMYRAENVKAVNFGILAQQRSHMEAIHVRADWMPANEWLEVYPDAKVRTQMARIGSSEMLNDPEILRQQSLKLLDVIQASAESGPTPQRELALTVRAAFSPFARRHDLDASYYAFEASYPQIDSTLIENYHLQPGTRWIHDHRNDITQARLVKRPRLQRRDRVAAVPLAHALYDASVGQPMRYIVPRTSENSKHQSARFRRDLDKTSTFAQTPAVMHWSSPREESVPELMARAVSFRIEHMEPDAQVAKQYGLTGPLPVLVVHVARPRDDSDNEAQPGTIHRWVNDVMDAWWATFHRWNDSLNARYDRIGEHLQHVYAFHRISQMTDLFGLHFRTMWRYFSRVNIPQWGTDLTYGFDRMRLYSDLAWGSAITHAGGDDKPLLDMLEEQRQEIYQKRQLPHPTQKVGNQPRVIQSTGHVVDTLMPVSHSYLHDIWEDARDWISPSLQLRNMTAEMRPNLVKLQDLMEKTAVDFKVVLRNFDFSDILHWDVPKMLNLMRAITRLQIDFMDDIMNLIVALLSDLVIFWDHLFRIEIYIPIVTPFFERVVMRNVPKPRSDFTIYSLFAYLGAIVSAGQYLTLFQEFPINDTDHRFISDLSVDQYFTQVVNAKPGCGYRDKLRNRIASIVAMARSGLTFLRAGWKIWTDTGIPDELDAPQGMFFQTMVIGVSTIAPNKISPETKIGEFFAAVPPSWFESLNYAVWCVPLIAGWISFGGKRSKFGPWGGWVVGIPVMGLNYLWDFGLAQANVGLYRIAALEDMLALMFGTAFVGMEYGSRDSGITRWVGKGQMLQAALQFQTGITYACIQPNNVDETKTTWPFSFGSSIINHDFMPKGEVKQLSIGTANSTTTTTMTTTAATTTSPATLSASPSSHLVILPA